MLHVTHRWQHYIQSKQWSEKALRASMFNQANWRPKWACPALSPKRSNSLQQTNCITLLCREVIYTVFLWYHMWRKESTCSHMPLELLGAIKRTPQIGYFPKMLHMSRTHWFKLCKFTARARNIMFRNVKAYFTTEYLNIFKSGHTSDEICAHIVTVRS